MPSRIRRDAARVYLRDSGYYYRRTVPSDLRAAFGQRELRFSLETRLLAEARPKARRVSVVIDGLISRVRAKAGAVDSQELQRIIQHEIRQALEQDERDRAAGLRIVKGECPDTHPAELEQEVLCGLESDAREALALGAHRQAEHWAGSVIEERGLVLDAGEYRTLCRELLKAQVTVLKVLQRRAVGDYDTEAQPTSSLPSTAPSEPVSKVIEAYAQELKRADRWTAKTEAENLAIYRMFVDIVGDRPIREIDHKAIRAYKDTLARLPPNMKKMRQFRGKSIREILAMSGVPGLAVNTVNKNLIRVASLFKWAVKNGYADINPAEEMTLPKPKRPDEFRDVFTATDLAALFGPTYGTGKHPYMYWLPLLGLYTGARLEELCQLHLDDIQEVDGVHALAIREGEGKRLKTKAAERLVPIHPRLMDLGLLKYVARLKAKGQKRLFPELRRRRDGYSQAASRWFARYKVRCGITDPTKVYHSFRHTAINALKQAGADGTRIAELVGHEVPGMTLGRYGKRYAPRVLLEIVKLLDFDIRVSPFSQ